MSSGFGEGSAVNISFLFWRIVPLSNLRTNLGMKPISIRQVAKFLKE